MTAFNDLATWLHTLPLHAQKQSVLILASAEQAEGMKQALGEAKLATADETVVMDDHLMALGYIARHRPHVVIATAAAMDGEAAATAAALRRLLPDAALLLVGPAKRRKEYHPALDAGFDQYLAQPLTASDLRETFDRAVQRHAPAVALAPYTETSQADTAEAGTAVGDVDLVDQLLRDPRQLPHIAMRLIAQQSAIADMNWSEDLSTLPSDHVRIGVSVHDRVVGYLHAPPPIEEAQLARWAQWMGHWMTLRQHMIDLWHMALKDDLTGVWNRRYFSRFLDNILQRAAKERFRVTVLVFDIDDFKIYNDRYGHAAGDDILRETARLMQSVVRDHDVVARIGGDEFAVIFWDAEAPRQPNSEHPINVRRATERFQRAICTHKFPKLLEEARDTLTISAGLAGFPWDGRTPDELLAKADEMAMHSKRQGKDAVTFGPGALHQDEA